jgi:organic hydroperoxide reductase OsmC/OhrA
MADFPHVYTTSALGTHDPILKLNSANLPELQVSPPVEFGGPEGYWNPEAFFSAAISTCFILTFKSIARAMKLEWIDINVDVDAYLDKNVNQLSFTKVDIFVTLRVPRGQSFENYQNALTKAESSCLITNSIKAETHLHPVIQET